MLVGLECLRVLSGWCVISRFADVVPRNVKIFGILSIFAKGEHRMSTDNIETTPPAFPMRSSKNTLLGILCRTKRVRRSYNRLTKWTTTWTSGVDKIPSLPKPGIGILMEGTKNIYELLRLSSATHFTGLSTGNFAE